MNSERTASQSEGRPEAEQASFEATVPLPTMEKWEKGAPDFKIVTECLVSKGYQVVGKRRLLSSGFNGPLYLIETDKGPVVEKTFIYGGESATSEESVGHRMMRMSPESMDKEPVRAHHSVFEVEKAGEVGDTVVDWVFNEETALNDLEGIPGIPKLIAVAMDGSKGSVVEEFIDGYELTSLPQHVDTKEEVHDIIERIMTTYDAAARRAYVYNDPAGSTILIDRNTKQPYLIDWYNHCHGDMVSDVDPLLEQGRVSLRSLEQSLIDQLQKP